MHLSRPEVDPRSRSAPLVIAAVCTRRRVPLDWWATFAAMRARFLIGLGVGFGLSLLLVPALVWRNPPSGRAPARQFNWPGGSAWPFAAVLLMPAIVGASTTRVRIQKTPQLDSVRLPDAEDGSGERIKSGCMGILLPAVTAAYGLYYLSHRRMLDRFGRLRDPDVVISIGLCAIGIAIFVHGLGFVPYERVRGLKYFVAACGATVFFLGLIW